MNTSFAIASPWRFFIFILFCALSLSGAERARANGGMHAHPSFKFFGREQGLHAGVIYCVLEDREGFIWQGTRFGLRRYDGYQFKSYGTLSSDTIGALTGPISGICEDSSGLLWIIAKDVGIASLNKRTNKVTYYRNDPGDPHSLSSKSIRSFHIDRNGQLWALSQSLEVNFYDVIGDRFLRYASPWALREAVSPVSATPQTEDGLILPTTFGDVMFDFTDRTYRQIPSITSRLGRLSTISRIDDSLWFAAAVLDSRDYSSSFVVNIRSRECIHELKHGDALQLKASVRGEDGTLLILSIHKGLITWDVKTNVIRSVPVPGLTDAQCLYRDRSARIWLGAASGMYLSNPATQKFNSYRFTHPHEQASSGLRNVSAARALYASGGRMEAGDQIGALYAWDTIKREFKFVHQLLGTDQRPAPYSLHQIASDRKGRWMYATNSGPLFTTAQTGDRALAKGVVGGPGYAVCEDHMGAIWIGILANDQQDPKHRTALLRYDPATRKTRYYSLRLPSVSSAFALLVFSLYEDRQRQLWIGSSAGLFKYDRRLDTCVPVLHPRSDGGGHAPNNIWVIFEDSRSNLWLGSWGRGLHKFDRESNSYADFTTEQGLPNNNVQSIVEDERGTLWIATSEGISRFDPTSSEFTNFSTNDGLLDNEFQPKAAARLPSGEIFFGGLSGVTSFFPSAFTTESVDPPVVITGLSISGSEQGHLYDGDTIELHYDRNDIIFECASLDFGSKDSKRYSYLIEGLDDDWTQPSSRNSGAYNNIPPGRYLLRIKATGSNGKWLDREVRLHIVVPPPYWETWWFRTLIGLTVAGAIGIFAVRSRSHQRDQHLRLERAREKERIDLAGDIHDGPLQDLYAARFLIADERDALGELLLRVRGDLRSISSRLQPPKLRSDLAEDLDVLVRAFGQRSAKTQFTSACDGKPIDLPEAVSRNIFRIVRTSLTNVQKHSAAAHCTVTTSFTPASVMVSISDDGVGFDPRSLKQRTHDHLGIFLMRYYADEIKAKLEIDSSPGNGASVQLTWVRDHRILRRLGVMRRLGNTFGNSSSAI